MAVSPRKAHSADFFIPRAFAPRPITLRRHLLLSRAAPVTPLYLLNGERGSASIMTSICLKSPRSIDGCY
jgi:hypothetical protein